MKTKIISAFALILGLTFFPYIVLGGVVVTFGILGIFAFFNIFYMMITGKGRGNYDSFN